MEIRMRERENVVIFDIIGDFRKPKDGVATLHQRIRDELSASKRQYIINLNETDSLDDFSVAGLFASFVSVKTVGGFLVIVSMKSSVELGWDRIWGHTIPRYLDEEEAIKSFPDS